MTPTSWRRTVCWGRAWTSSTSNSISVPRRRITRVATGEEALAVLNARHFDLVITMTRLGEMDVRKFGRR